MSTYILEKCVCIVLNTSLGLVLIHESTTAKLKIVDVAEYNILYL
jgi:hypothetical protein